jgi:hypothetical protein
MPRRRGPPVLKWIDPRRQDFVGIRQRLSLGGAPLEDLLSRLYAEKGKLFKDLVRCDKARTKVNIFLRDQSALIRRIPGKTSAIARIRREADARELVIRLGKDIESKQLRHDAIDVEIAGIRKHVEEAQRPLYMRSLIAQRDDCARRINTNEGTKWTRKRFRQLNAELKVLGHEEASVSASPIQPAFPWQLELTRIIELADLLDGTDEDKTTSPRGKAIHLTAADLQQRLRELGHRVDVRTLRRFLREKLEVKLAGEQGRRRDLGK